MRFKKKTIYTSRVDYGAKGSVSRRARNSMLRNRAVFFGLCALGVVAVIAIFAVLVSSSQPRSTVGFGPSGEASASGGLSLVTESEEEGTDQEALDQNVADEDEDGEKQEGYYDDRTGEANGGSDSTDTDPIMNDDPLSGQGASSGEAHGVPAGSTSAADWGDLNAEGQPWGTGLTDADWEYLVLLNKTHSVDRDYKPADLAPIKYYAEDRPASCRYMRQTAADAFHRMIEAAKAEQGYNIVITTAYRSYDYQKILYDNYVAKDGQALADTYSARPGTSEHQTGLAADLSCATINYRLSGDFASTDEGKWINDNAYRFGFILRYPEGKTDVTGYIYEPWHVRYVGTVAAKEIFESGLVFEEDLEKIGGPR
jgi:D-alanyl-D-alanine carboxypeptidase